ncbi:unnamed protein product [Lasius platythorax]|uniref:Uncharacterized protein n=1 Tax=Lasius platythorax TaxID=488582 RepID=A0AAV2P6P8_9HYME
MRHVARNVALALDGSTFSSENAGVRKKRTCVRATRQHIRNADVRELLLLLVVLLCLPVVIGGRWLWLVISIISGTP